METVASNGEQCNLKPLELREQQISSPSVLFLLTQPCDSLSAPLYSNLSILELGCVVKQSLLHVLSALLEQQISLKHIRMALVDSCQF